jgi:hypothetical protein
MLKTWIDRPLLQGSLFVLSLLTYAVTGSCLRSLNTQLKFMQSQGFPDPSGNPVVAIRAGSGAEPVQDSENPHFAIGKPLQNKN